MSKLEDAEKALADLEQFRNRTADTRNAALIAMRDDPESKKPETTALIAAHADAISVEQKSSVTSRQIDEAAQAVLDAREEKA